VTTRAALLLSTSLLLSGCGSLAKLSEVGHPPAMTPSSDPTADPAWRPLSLPMPNPHPLPASANSLWRTGSRAFFKDQRAANVGDIITVVVNIADVADFENNTSAVRTGVTTMGMTNLFGLETAIKGLFGAAASPAQLVNTNDSGTNTGTSDIKRNETVTVRLAGVITQVLGNGNLVVAARQEVRVNSELREMVVTGVVRPQDIASDNTVTHDRMAEARISYGGRGQLTDIQTPRWGQQILDILLPF
jgi:flagellar L-ring protein precursor FlgH